MANTHTPAPPSAAQLRVNSIRDGISELYEQCTDKQRAFLNSIHDNAPWKGLANCPEVRLDETYELLRRTVASNITKTGSA